MVFLQNRIWMLVLLMAIAVGKCPAQKHYPPAPRPPHVIEVNDSCYYNGHLSAAQRRQKFPFNKGYKVMVISFDGYMAEAPINHDTIVDSLVYERKILTQAQIDSFTDVLFNYNYSETVDVVSEAQYGCYWPREAFLFIGDNGKIAHWLEICFECRGRRSDLEKRAFGKFCDGKYELIKQFCVSIGITHYTDTKSIIITEEPIINAPAFEEPRIDSAKK